MSAKDLFYGSVKKALINDGWTITHDPYRIKVGDIEYRMDFGAEKFLAAIKGETQIVVEVKSFVEQSKTYAFHQALGQFNAYFVTLKLGAPERILFLAIPDYIYSDYLKKSFFK